MDVTHLFLGKSLFLFDFLSILVFVEKFNLESLSEFDGFLSWRGAGG